MICISLSACGKKNNSSSSAPQTTTFSPAPATYTTTAKNNDKDDDSGIMEPDNGDVSENGVMPDVTSPLEKIPDIIETAASGAEDIVSDIIDDLT